ncbi:MAG: hypothetical protein IT376_16465 [Polyangiaceae bacterium]|nr:hypothetical protein [Polyangiaceae bacterium]
MPDGGHSWVALADDPAVAIATARRLSSLPESQTLAGRGDLAALRRSAGHTVGFVTLTELVNTRTGASRVSTAAEVRARLERLRALPDRGLTPILLQGASVQGDGGRVTLRLIATFTPAAISSAFSWWLPRAAERP